VTYVSKEQVNMNKKQMILEDTIQQHT